MSSQSDTYFMLGVALGVLLLVIIVFMAGVHHRQHWETDRIVEGKLMREAHPLDTTGGSRLG